MSLCSNTLRANLCRSRVARPQTLLPFLYQTTTIQQRKPVTRPTDRRYASRGSPLEDDIPFADAEGNLPPPIAEAHPARKTTMTAAERAAFEKLYKTFNAQGQGRQNGSKGEHEELDQIADEYYEDDEDNSGNSLDKVFDTVLQGRSRAQQSQIDASQTLAAVGNVESNGTSASSLGEKPSPGKEKQSAAKAERERIRKLELDERERVHQLLKNSRSDHELWEIMEKEVFDPIRRLDLDGTQGESKTANKINIGKGKSKASASKNVEQGILFSNYPHHLLHALFVLRHHFPASPYALNILPTMKSLGRSSYALGATTSLYQHLLRTAWIQQSSYELMDTLLSDMEANVIEFDSTLLETLDAVLREHTMALSGKLGTGLQWLHNMEYWIEGSWKIKKWRDLIADRLGIKKEERIPQDSLQAPKTMRSLLGFRSNKGARQVSGERTHQRFSADAIPFVDDPGTGIEPNEPKETSTDSKAADSQSEPQQDDNDESMPAKVLV